MMENTFIPFFVADRIASLKILAGVTIPNGKRMGIMSHANCSSNFFKALRNYPCIDPDSCPFINGSKCNLDIYNNPCKKSIYIKKSIIKICDSGVFQKNGCGSVSYSDLFEKYKLSGVDYGVIIDYLKDKEKTLKSAEKAIDYYKSNKENKMYNFKLVGVAQGETIDDYISCYKELVAMGYDYIAIGGMLKKRDNSSRYVNVRDEKLLKNILKEIRNFDPNRWIFALGCYSPKRHSIFLQNNIFGSDYKGWIFQYKGHSPKRGDLKYQKSRFLQVRKFIESEVLLRSQNWKNGNKLLIVQCSKRKKEYKHLAQAINVYDGPTFRLLRKYIHDFSNDNGLDILIVSAKYGLIEPTKLIKKYDQKMTYDRALELQNYNSLLLKDLSKKKKYAEIILNLSHNYFLSIESGLKYFSNAKRIDIIGRIGTRQKILKEILLSS